jgi:hypothetical protein
VCRLSRKAAHLKSSAFCIPIHPLSSHLRRLSVNPSITYLESVMIFSSWFVGAASIAVMTAPSSPIWFDWACPGMQCGALCSCYGLVQTILHHILCRLSHCLHMLHLCELIFLVGVALCHVALISLLGCWRSAHTVGILQYKPIQFRNLTNQHAQIADYIVKMPAVSGSVNILKHSDRSSLLVMVGSKRITPLRGLAIAFCLFRCLVRDRLPWARPGERGLNLGKICSSRVCASVAQAWGFLQPFVLSSEQLWQ